ncbi:MAG: 50S ribosomal protein L21e [Promethearchaeota archaeon]
MVRHHGYRTKSRKVFTKHPRKRGLASLGQYLIEYNIGDKVDIIANPSVHKRGFPHKRFHGKTGVIVGKRGRCFEVEFTDQNKKKMLIVGVEHIRKNRLAEVNSK